MMRRLARLALFGALLVVVAEPELGAAPVHRPADRALAKAVQINDIAGVRAALAKGAHANTRNDSGSPVLVVAANHGQQAIVQALLGKGANINARGVNGTTALIDAVSQNHPAVAKLLLSRGANPNLTYTDSILNGTTALMFAAELESADLVDALVSKGARASGADAFGETALHSSAAYGRITTCAALLKHGAKIDARTFQGYTPLMYAVMHGHPEVASLLIKNGANVNARTDCTRTLAVAAAFTDGEAADRMLKSSRAKTLQEDGMSVMCLARQDSATAIVDLLRKAGARETPEGGCCPCCP